MSLSVIQNFQFPLNSDLFHLERKDVITSGVYQGLIVEKSLTPMNVNVGTGFGVMPSGTKVVNEDSVVNAGGLSTNNTGEIRIDLIVIEYIHSYDSNINQPLIKVIEGEPGSQTPIPTEDQLAIAEIHLPPASSSLLNEYILNIAPVPIFSNDGVIFSDVNYDSGTDEFILDEKNLYRPHGSKNLWIDTDIMNKMGSIPSSMSITATKMVLEGMFWGNFETVHVYDSFDILTKTTVTIQEGEEPFSVVEVFYTYDDNNRIKTETFSDGYVNVLITYTYDENNYNKLPNVKQEVSFV